MDAEQAIAALAKWEQDYQSWAAPIDQFMREGFPRVGREGYDYGTFEAELQALRRARLAEHNPYPAFNALLDELGPAYLTAPDGARARLRAAVADMRGVLHALLGYIYHAATQLREMGDFAWLRRGLAAASIENCAVDYRDLTLALAELYTAAKERRLSPRRYFRQVGELSDTERPRGGNRPMRDMLADFHSYGALRERRLRGRAGK